MYVNGPLHTSTVQVIYMALWEFASEFFFWHPQKVVVREASWKREKILSQIELHFIGDWNSRDYICFCDNFNYSSARLHHVLAQSINTHYSAWCKEYQCDRSGYSTQYALLWNQILSRGNSAEDTQLLLCTASVNIFTDLFCHFYPHLLCVLGCLKIQ